MPAWPAHDYCRTHLSLVIDAQTYSTQQRAHSSSKGCGGRHSSMGWRKGLLSLFLPEHLSPEGCGFHVT